MECGKKKKIKQINKLSIKTEAKFMDFDTHETPADLADMTLNMARQSPLKVPASTEVLFFPIPGSEK